MTAPRLTAYEQVAIWKTAYDAIKDELTPSVFRQRQAELNAQAGCPADCVLDHQHLSSGLTAGLILSRLLMANDRQAALVAAIITSTGVKMVSVGDITDEV
jgi:hypothetical protein